MPVLDTYIDFDIYETNNLKTIGIVDVSNYKLGDTFTDTTVKVRAPGYNAFTTINFNIKKINILNSNNLGFTSVSNINELQNLPDGIYEINLQGKLNGTDKSITKNYLRVNALMKKYEEIVYSRIEGCNTQKNIVNKLKEIEILIYGAIANANRCNIGKATSLYRLASSELDRLKC